MQNFVFHNPVKILFGKGQIAHLGREIPKGARVLLAYGGGSIKANGVHAQVMAVLGRGKFHVAEFGGIEPNPRFETLMKAVRLCRDERLDFILAVGGGSVVDGAKFIAAAVPFIGDEWQIVQRARITEALPLGVVLTLPATGSEMNAFSVISRIETGEKLGFGSPLVLPRFSVLDPETTYSLPERQLGNGMVDAFVHVLEQYLTHPVGAVVQDRMAEAVLQSLIETGFEFLAGPPEYEARANLMWAATMALNGLLGAGVPQDWSTHLMGHEITALTGIDHARTLAAIWPAVMLVKRDAKRAKLLQYAERVWHIDQGSEDERIDEAIRRTRAFFESLGVPTTLSAHSVPETIVDEVASRLEARGSLPLGENGDMDADQVRAVLRVAL